MTNTKIDAASMSLGDLLLVLRPGQAWALALAIVSLLTGAFVLGNRLAGDARGRSETQLQDSKRELEEAAAREQFYELYAPVLVGMVKDQGNSVSSETTEAASRLADFIAPIWRAQQAAAGQGKFDLGTKVVISKGYDGINDSHFILRGRGSWPIPGLVKDLVMRR